LDEISKEKGKRKFVTVVSDLDKGSLLEVIDSHKSEVDVNKTQIIVKTITFNDLLETYNTPLFIDYLSLDTEGSELEILKSVDLKKYTFGLIDVEHNFIEPRRSQIRELLTSNGYIYIRENKFDDSYKHISVSDKSSNLISH
jgi:hypothetical protein